ncbi:N-acetylmuramoyl-L-alanine amidase family protein [Sporosarcina sp. NPDC096371]|uniref:peptidoglycan recognition protein family protein n=1 Tax=Sporosarcina sp. NPDC096371 TaxID=3364530 RepID=UPI0038022585
MTYSIINKYISTSLYPLKATYPMTPEYVTLHNTFNDATALNEIAYMTSNKDATSYHVAIDDQYAVQAIPFNRNGWHAGDGNGDGNRKSIGIEICYSKSGGAKYKAAEANAVDYIAHLLKQQGWAIDRVKWHRDWSGKNCPHRIIDEGRMQSVREQIEKRLNELNTPPKEEHNVEDKEKNARADKSFQSAQDFVKASGISDGTYPRRQITRQEVWSMLERLNRYLDGKK